MNRSSAVLLLTLAVLGSGCTTTHFREKADRETYAVIEEKAPIVPNMDPEFTIDTPEEGPSLEGLPKADPHAEFMGPSSQPGEEAYVISLEKALELAVKYNRTYQNRKEQVYLAALQLTLDRHQWTPIFAGGASAAYARSTRDVATLSNTARLAIEAPDLVRQLGELTGTPGQLISRYAQLVEGAATVTGLNRADVDIVDERSVPGQTRLGVNYLLAGGAQIAVDLTSNFLRFLTGDPRTSATSALAATINQPLLRGAGRRVAQETLTQAERDVLYELRSFALFRKDFAVDIAESYFRVLQARDAVRNNFLGYQALRQDAERQAAEAEVGRTTETAVGLSRQAELNAQDNWIQSIQAYKQALDEFKIELGLSTDAPIMLDQTELDNLLEEGLLHPTITDQEAVQVAMVTRLDLYNVRDQVADAERKVYVAANALKPGLDLILQGDLTSLDDNRWTELDFRRARLSAGLDFDPDFDKKAERNQYRASLIAFERAARELELAEDSVKLQVREDLRRLEQALRSFEIRQQGVQLAQRRVEEQALRAEYGQATARDQVDAQNDLIDARNALTDALVSHTITRLQFWRDMGILYIKPNGQWEDITDADYPESGVDSSGAGTPEPGEGNPDVGPASEESVEPAAVAAETSPLP